MRLSVRTKLTGAIMAALLAMVGLLITSMYDLAIRQLTHEFGQKLVALAQVAHLVETRSIATVSIRNRTQPVAIHEVLGLKSQVT